MKGLGLVLLLLATCACVSQKEFDSADVVTPQNATEGEAAQLARVWIDYWNEGNPRSLPLTDTFVHVSPFGRIEGRENYLDTVIPMSERNVTHLTVNRVLDRGDQAVVWFDMHTPSGTIPVCDWVIVSNGEIAEIHSFYDASTLRYE